MSGYRGIVLRKIMQAIRISFVFHDVTVFVFKPGERRAVATRRDLIIYLVLTRVTGKKLPVTPVLQVTFLTVLTCIRLQRCWLPA
ncbi:hypothetical protein V5799_019198 [Amblyomma americanum]|uniref:Uncharacterized protein n=1 Tax=Amblyomma americanum TaxID=6943 RepID=A0AAQ4EXK5_AMBAM